MTSRRAFLTTLGLAGAAVGATVAGCGGPTGPQQPPASGGMPGPASPAPSPAPSQPARRRVFVGTYTDGDDPGTGIGTGQMDTASGRLTVTGTVAVENPSFLALAPSGQVLYAVDEQEDGKVSAAKLTESGLILINSQPSRGAGPTHLCVHPSGRYVLSANYDSGSVVVHPVRADGGLAPPSDLVVHTGSGPDHERQQEPHAHQIVPDPTGRYLLSVDLGTDTVYSYQLDLNTGKLTQRHTSRLRAGSGPRHLAFSVDGRFAFVAAELGGTVISCHYADGVLTPVAEQPSVPGASGNQPGEVVVHPDGKHVYTSNRGPDSVSIFVVGPDGHLTARGQVPCGGRNPRFIGLDPVGGYLYSANQDSATVTTMAVESNTGALTAAAPLLRTPQPTCLVFA